MHRVRKKGACHWAVIEVKAQRQQCWKLRRIECAVIFFPGVKGKPATYQCHSHRPSRMSFTICFCVNRFFQSLVTNKEVQLFVLPWHYIVHGFWRRVQTEIFKVPDTCRSYHKLVFIVPDSSAGKLRQQEVMYNTVVEEKRMPFPILPAIWLCLPDNVGSWVNNGAVTPKCYF